jgi:hypothetical protein
MLHHSAQSQTVTQAQNRCQLTWLNLHKYTAASSSCSKQRSMWAEEDIAELHLPIWAQQVPIKQQQLQPGHVSSFKVKP